jgi:hypothetical protein
MPEGTPPLHYKIRSPLPAVRLATHPGSSLRDPTDTLVNIPPEVTIEIEGAVSSSGLVTVLWSGSAFSVLHEELESKAEPLGVD